MAWEDDISPEDLELRDFLRNQGRIPADAIVKRIKLVFDTWSDGRGYRRNCKRSYQLGYDPSKFHEDDFQIRGSYCHKHWSVLQYFPDGYHELFPKICKSQNEEFFAVQKRMERERIGCNKCKKLSRETKVEQEERMRMCHMKDQGERDRSGRKRRISGNNYNDEDLEHLATSHKRHRPDRSQSIRDIAMEFFSSSKDQSIPSVESKPRISAGCYFSTRSGELSAPTPEPIDYTELPLHPSSRSSYGAEYGYIALSPSDVGLGSASRNSSFRKSSQPEYTSKPERETEFFPDTTSYSTQTSLRPARNTSSLLNSEPEEDPIRISLSDSDADHDALSLPSYESSLGPASSTSDNNDPIPIPRCQDGEGERFVEGEYIPSRTSNHACGYRGTVQKQKDPAGGYDTKKLNRQLYDRQEYYRMGNNQKGFDRDRYHRYAYDRSHSISSGTHIDGYNRFSFDRDDYDRNGYHRDGYNREGYNREGFDREGYDRKGYDREGWMRHWNQGRGQEAQWPPTSNKGNFHTPPGYDPSNISLKSDVRPTVDDCTFFHEHVGVECSRCGFGSAFPNQTQDAPITSHRAREYVNKSQSRSRSMSISGSRFANDRTERRRYPRPRTHRPYCYRMKFADTDNFDEMKEIKKAEEGVKGLLTGGCSKSFGSSLLKALDEEQADWEKREQGIMKGREQWTGREGFQKALTDVIKVLQVKQDELRGED